MYLQHPNVMALFKVMERFLFKPSFHYKPLKTLSTCHRTPTHPSAPVPPPSPLHPPHATAAARPSNLPTMPARRLSPSLSVLLYVPNIIGYLRIALSILAFSHYSAPTTFALYYSLAFVLDAFDGLAARVFNQSSDFGALLDMLTDRCATAALLVVIAATRRASAKLTLPLAFLDGYSHWLQFAAGLCSAAKSHKEAGRGRALEWYYWRPVLTFVCTFNEFCFIAYYMLAAGAPGPELLPNLAPGMSAAHLVFYFSIPVCAFKQLISVRQIFSAHYTIRDAIAAASKSEPAATAAEAEAVDTIGLH